MSDTITVRDAINALRALSTTIKQEATVRGKVHSVKVSSAVNFAKRALASIEKLEAAITMLETHQKLLAAATQFSAQVQELAAPPGHKSAHSPESEPKNAHQIDSILEKIYIQLQTFKRTGKPLNLLGSELSHLAEFVGDPEAINVASKLRPKNSYSPNPATDESQGGFIDLYHRASELRYKHWREAKTKTEDGIPSDVIS